MQEGTAMNLARLKKTTLLNVVLVALAAVLAAYLLTLVVGMEPAEAAFPGQNGKIAFVARNLEQSGYSDIYVVNPDGTGRVQLTDGSLDDTSPDWSPDGTKIAYVHGGAGDLNADYNYPGTIMVMNSDGSGKRKLLDDGSSPAWSPDGTKIAFSREGDLWTVDAEGSAEETLLVESPPECEYLLPDWSPDGRKLALTELCYEDAGGELLPFFHVATINANGSEFARLTNSNNDRGGEYFPDWSPDGTKITYGAFHLTGGTSDIWVMNSDGSQKRQLTFEDAGATYDGEYYSRSSRSTWAPDGTKIVFAMNTCCSTDLDGIIHLMNPDGTGRVPIIDAATGEPLEGTSPDWSPLAAHNERCTIKGDEKPNVLTGTNKSDVICGFGGPDIIKGLGGNDLLRGGGGVDVIEGDSGADTLYGKKGLDYLDAVDGVRANDSIYGGGGLDVCRGDRGDTKRSC